MGRAMRAQERGGGQGATIRGLVSPRVQPEGGDGRMGVVVVA